MIDAFIDVLKTFPIGLVYVGMGVVLLGFARLLQDLVTPYKIQEQLRTHDNVALALSIAGYYLGIIILYVGAIYQPFTSSVSENLGFTTEYWQDVIEVLITTVIGIIILNIARIVVDKLVLYKFSTEKEIVEDHNPGTGAVEGAVYVAVGIVIAGSVAGVGGGPETSFAFLGLGLLTLIGYTLFYEFTTSFDVHDQIEDNNVAVGVALAGNLIAISIVVFKAIFGDFTTWEEGIAGFLVFAVAGAALLFVVRALIDLILFPRANVSHELAVDRNLGVAFIESAVLVSASLILFFAI
ncbi:MAG: DUF350 domain-containing protein [SAR202 cluster bacterium]|jgi:uncharacterized membrane protein YjfL (UPF0719 family)|nr:DUF350 domain-containing protein [SAR202 cluster bacterium]MDP6713823.1 DUF350 domain-containing protein [SAR202 cluster bacterium]